MCEGTRGGAPGSWPLTHPGDVEQGLDWVGLGSVV